MSTYTGNRLSVFVQDFKALGEWLPLIKWNCLAYLITMFRCAATTVSGTAARLLGPVL